MWSGEQALSAFERSGIAPAGRGEIGRLVRYATGRLYSTEPDEKWRAVRVLGKLAALMEDSRVRDLLRRLFWALNDESGAVPYGAPEAVGEILAMRPEFQAEFLEMLCGLATEEDVRQTGEIEKGVFWALGRVGPAVARCSPEAAAAVSAAAESHPDAAVRQLAESVRRRIQGGGETCVHSDLNTSEPEYPEPLPGRAADCLPAGGRAGPVEQERGACRTPQLPE